MGGKGTSVNYQAPQIPKDDTFEKYLAYQQQKESAAEARAAQEKAEEKAAADARKAAGSAGYAGLRQGVESQLRQGLISYQDATSQLRDYATKYEMTPPETDVTNLTNIYTQELLPGRRQTGIGAAYEEILGRQATEAEKSTAMERFGQGYYTSNEDLRNSLYKSTEYQDKFNQNYLDNYYDTMFGKQTTDAAGKKTGQRTFKFSSNLLPTMGPEVTTQGGADLTRRTGVTTPQFSDFTGTPAEIEEQQQNIRDTRQFLYSAGLTNLQGEIDKETQKLKTEGSKELAKIQSQGSIYNSLVGSFSF
jgi:hypothetical protein